jgi:hypothetical protein
VANVLDLPGSSVRDTLAGRNPLDQWISPFSGKNRTSGRDLLRTHGLAGRKDGWGNWTAGLATEIVTDPLSWFTLGGSALGKAGQAAKAAGIHGQRAANLAAKATGKKLGQVGTREARHLLTPSMIQAADPQAFAAMGKYASTQGFDLSMMMDEPLGGLAKFWPSGKVMGSQKLAHGMDQAADAFRHFKIPGTNIMPVADTANLLNAKAMGARSQSQLATAYDLFDKKEASRVSGKKMEARGAMDIKRAGLEGGENRDRRLMMERDDLAPPELQPFIKDFHRAAGTQPGRARRVGIPLGDVNERARLMGGRAKHVSRGLTASLEDVRSGTSGPEMSAFGREQMERMAWSHGADRGSDTVSRMGNLVQSEIDSGVLNGLSKEDQINYLAGTLRSNFQGELPDQFLGTKGFYLLKEYGKRGITPTVANANSLIAAANAGKKVSKKVLAEINPKDTWESAAKDLLGFTPEARKSGIYGNDPLQEGVKGFVNTEQKIANGETVLNHLLEKGFVKPGKDTVSVRNLMYGVKGTADKGLGMKAGSREWGAAKFILEKRGIDISKMSKKKAKKWISQVMNKHVDGETAKFLKQFKQGWDAPEQVGEMLKLYDNVHKLTSAVFTSLRPGFAPRNFASGQGANWLADQFTGRSVADIGKLSTGGVIEGASKNPILAAEAAKRGIQNLNDQQATDLLSELMYAHEMSSSYGAHQPHMTQASGGTSIQDVFQQIPGQHPFSAKQIAKRGVGMSGDTTLNPMKGDWQGLTFTGKKPPEKTTFAPLAAGEDVNAWAELMNRGAPFWALLQQGVEPGEAARRVMEAQVAYQPRFYTKTEQQVLGRLFQFFKYTKGQVPFVLKLLAEKPGGKLAQILRGINSFRGEDELTPDYIQETTSIPLGEQEDGTQRYLTGLGLNFEDPLSFATPSLQGIGMEAMSRTSLPIKGFLEGVTGTSFFQRAPHGGGRLLEDMDPAIGRLLANIGQGTGLRDENNKAPVRYPGSGLVEHLVSNSPLSMPVNMARTLTDPRKGPVAKASQTLTGLRISDISPATQDKVLRDRIGLIEKRLGARSFSDVYFPSEVKAGMSAKDQQLAATLAELRKLLDARSQTRKAERDKK